MKVFSVFNGIGCAAYCLKKNGVKIEKLYVSEIDKWANAENDRNHPESIHLGDVVKIWEDMFLPEMTEILASIDLLVGGVPDGYTKGASDSQRYKMLGNGWQCDTICHNFKYMPLANT